MLWDNPENGSGKPEVQMISDASSSDSQIPQNFTLNNNTDFDLERSELSLENVEVSSKLSRSLSRILSHPYGQHEDNDDNIPNDNLTKYPTIGMNKKFPTSYPEKEPYTVSFEGPDDTMHPHNWPFKKKVFICAALAYTTGVVSFGSSVFSPVIAEVSAQYNVSTVVGSLGISLYILGFAFGPVLWGPLSELLGRRLILVWTTFGFMIFQFACATGKDLQTILISRAFQGIFGSASLVVVPAAYSDVFDNRQRGVALPIFTLNVFSLPVMSQVMAGFIAHSHLSWRWTEYINGFMAAIAVAALYFVEETHHPIILVNKAKMIKRETGNWLIHAPHEEFELDFKSIVEKTLTRPLVMLFKEPIILLVSIYTAFIYGILYLLLSAYPIVFGKGYHMKGGVMYIPYLSIAVGMIGAAVWTIQQNKRFVKAIEQNGGRPVPEARLPAVFAGSIAFPIGLLWFTWTGHYPEKIHWMVPTTAGLFTGFGLLTIFNGTIGYIVDSYLIFAASALAANTFLRSGVACAFPLFAPIMFKNMGTNWAGLVLGIISIVLAPVPYMFYKYGKSIRARSSYLN